MTDTKPKILFIDLETTPIEAYTWGPKWETNLIEFTEHSRILSYSAKWLDGVHITKGWLDYKGYKPGALDDKAIVMDLWSLLDKADIVVAQNGNSFDLKIMNARFAFHKLTPPSPYKSLDTKLEARKYLRLPSNSLDDICDYFGIGRKLHHEGFPLWKACMAGDKAAWGRMKKYNKWDVVLLEKVYLLLLPWMKNHPNVGMYIGKLVCPKCGSGKMQSRGVSVNQTTSYKRVQCQDCGGWSRGPSIKRDIKPLVSI